MKNLIKKTILIDLDGVLNNYVGGFDKDIIPEIKTGAKEFLYDLANTYRLRLFTTRNKILACKWLIENNLDNIFEEVTNTKDLCWLFIDDRCICFNGDFNALKNNIDTFKPYYK